jgi:hypothetical protein
MVLLREIVSPARMPVICLSDDLQATVAYRCGPRLMARQWHEEALTAPWSVPAIQGSQVLRQFVVTARSGLHYPHGQRNRTFIRPSKPPGRTEDHPAARPSPHHRDVAAIEILGHSRTAVTLEIYTAADDTSKREAITKLNGLFGPGAA